MDQARGEAFQIRGVGGTPLFSPDKRFAAAICGTGISNWLSDYGGADIPRTKESEFFGPPWEAQNGTLLLKQSPITHAAKVTTPTLFIHGEADLRVPIEQAANNSNSQFVETPAAHADACSIPLSN